MLSKAVRVYAVPMRNAFQTASFCLSHIWSESSVWLGVLVSLQSEIRQWVKATQILRRPHCPLCLNTVQKCTAQIASIFRRNWVIVTESHIQSCLNISFILTKILSYIKVNFLYSFNYWNGKQLRLIYPFTMNILFSLFNIFIKSFNTHCSLRSQFLADW